MFAKMNDVLVILVAHPKKMATDKDGKRLVPTPHDISGSSNFYNKADYCMSFYRDQDDFGALTNRNQIYIQKVKFKHLGQTGMTEMDYNPDNGKLEDAYAIGDTDWANSNWLEVFEKKPKKIA